MEKYTWGKENIRWEDYHVGPYKKFWDVRASIQVCKERIKVMVTISDADGYNYAVRGRHKESRKYDFLIPKTSSISVLPYRLTVFYVFLTVIVLHRMEYFSFLLLAHN